MMNHKTITVCIIALAITAGTIAISTDYAYASNSTKIDEIHTKVLAFETELDTIKAHVAEIKRYMNNAGDEGAFMWMHHCGSADRYCIHSMWKQRMAIANTQNEILSLLHTIKGTNTAEQNSTPLWINTQLIDKLAGISMTTTLNDSMAIQNNIAELATEIRTVAEQQQ